MYYITIISDLRPSPLRDELRQRGCIVNEVHFSSFPSAPTQDPGATADVIICFPVPDESFRSGYLTYSMAEGLRSDLAALPHDRCMMDGRKWRAVPFLPFADEMGLSFGALVLQRVSGGVKTFREDEDAYRQIIAVASEYRDQVIAGLDDLGFLVRYDHGRLRVGPALGGTKKLENDFYLASADRTRGDRSRFITMGRDLAGIQYEIDQLEFLINKKDLKEDELQRFFEENPHFLAHHRQGTPMPHVRFPLSGGEHLIPDFLMRPATAAERDSNWEVLDLKLPNAKLLAGKGNRSRLSQEVMAAIAQLKDYGDYFSNPANETVIQQILRHALKYPRLAVLIGRLPAGGEVEALEKAQHRDPSVRLITYDEILDFQRKLLN